jgi:hypothetical protein
MTHTTSNNEKKEHFNTLTLVNTNENKQKIKTAFHKFFKLFLDHTYSLKEINDDYINIIDKYTNADISITYYLENMNSKLNNLQHIKIDLDKTIPIEKEFNALIINLNELFSTHKKLFNNPNKAVEFREWTYNEEKWGNNNKDLPTNCNTLTLNESDGAIINFYYNLNNQLDVIEAKNIGQLKLIKINIDNIKNIINNSYFNKTFNSKLLNEFDFYYKLLDIMYNKNSVNIFNIINEKINMCVSETNYDKSKLIINNQNLEIINKSFTELEGKFQYFELDKIFMTANSANTHFTKTKGGLKLWQNFCEKLTKLNKPNKKNLILKKFNIDLIEKKTKYIKQLEDNIFNIQNKMNDTELQHYDINRIRTNDQADKQYQAIKKGIDNIKNRNKIKINLT